jgi:hypothetical protein
MGTAKVSAVKPEAHLSLDLILYHSFISLFSIDPFTGTTKDVEIVREYI